jgi:hypothetical protein
MRLEALGRESWSTRGFWSGKGEGVREVGCRIALGNTLGCKEVLRRMQCETRDGNSLFENRYLDIMQVTLLVLNGMRG